MRIEHRPNIMKHYTYIELLTPPIKLKHLCHFLVNSENPFRDNRTPNWVVSSQVVYGIYVSLWYKIYIKKTRFRAPDMYLDFRIVIYATKTPYCAPSNHQHFQIALFRNTK